MQRTLLFLSMFRCDKLVYIKNPMIKDGQYVCCEATDFIVENEWAVFFMIDFPLA